MIFEPDFEGRPLPLADVAAYRPCGKKMAEKLRLDAINRKVDESAFGPGVTKAIVDDRDWFMAQVSSSRACNTSPSVGVRESLARIKPEAQSVVHHENANNNSSSSQLPASG